MALVPLMHVESEPERLAVVALLEAHGVPCFVQGEGFGGLYPGIQIEHYNSRRIMVPDEALAAARELLTDFRAAPTETPPAQLDWLDALRCAAEALLGGWIVPRPRAKREVGNDAVDRTREGTDA